MMNKIKTIMNKEIALSILKKKHIDLTQQFEEQYKSFNDYHYLEKEMIDDRNFLNALKFIIKESETKGRL